MNLKAYRKYERLLRERAEPEEVEREWRRVRRAERVKEIVLAPVVGAALAVGLYLTAYIGFAAFD